MSKPIGHLGKSLEIRGRDVLIFCGYALIVVVVASFIERYFLNGARLGFSLRAWLRGLSIALMIYAGAQSAICVVQFAMLLAKGADLNASRRTLVAMVLSSVFFMTGVAMFFTI